MITLKYQLENIFLQFSHVNRLLSTYLHTYLPVCPDWEKFCHFGKILKVFGCLCEVYLVPGKILNLFFASLNAAVQILIDVNGQIFKI